MENSPDPKDIHIFVEICKQGSLSAAARQLNLPNSHVSRRLKNLEQALGCTLINRGTRHFEITDVGKRYWEITEEAFNQLTQAQAYIESLKGEPTGLLKLMCPFEFGLYLTECVIPNFLKKYPKVDLDVTFKNRPELEDYARADITIEISKIMAPRTYIQKKLFSVRRRFFASPQFLKQKPFKRIEDFEPKYFFQLLPERGVNSANNSTCDNVRTGESRDIVMKYPARINSLTALKKLAVAGEGICLVPEFVVSRELQLGELRPFMQDWSSSEVEIFAVTEPRKQSELKVKALIDELIKLKRI